jgi:hypothetical protein
MKNIFFTVLIAILLLTPVTQAAAQSNTTTATTFDTTGFPQWAKDLRRWDIVAFGSFPFSMLTTTMVYDMIRWQEANNFDFSDEGRRYAPWPLKSAGAVEMTKEEYEKTILTAVAVSAVIALIDLAIVLIKRNKERRRIESRAASSAVIEKAPYGEAEESEEAKEAEE